MSDSIADVMEPVPGEQPKKPKGDLGVRTVSAVVMVAVAGTAIWLGGWLWNLFVGVIALGVLWEWSRLVAKFNASIIRSTSWRLAGIVFVAIASWTLIDLRASNDQGLVKAGSLIAQVIAIDVFAYAFGRTIGGPKIAPRISPSKTWAGLFGACAGSALCVHAYTQYQWYCCNSDLVFYPSPSQHLGKDVFEGIIIAIIAQSGDFFESWMKRRAGVKDSGSLIPGHGGLFDRVDGLLAVSFVVGFSYLAYNVVAYGSLPI